MEKMFGDRGAVVRWVPVRRGARGSNGSILLYDLSHNVLE